MAVKLCPLRNDKEIHYGTERKVFLECLEDKCAWFIRNDNQCAIKSTAQNLEAIYMKGQSK